MFLLKKLKKNLPKSSGKAPKVEPVPGGHESPPLITGKTDKLEASTEETAREESIGEKLQSSLANPTAEGEKAPPLPQEPATHKACPKESKPLPRRYETCRVCEEKFLLTDFEKHIEVCGSPDCKGAGKGEGKLPVISNFSILAVIAQGSYGEVYVVRKKSTEDLFAMKKIPKNSSRTSLKHVRNEARILHSVMHPFIIQSYFAFQSPSSLYFVMQYAAGGDIYSLLDTFSTFPLYTAKFYIAETVMALGYLHSLGIVHRDVKPDNLLLSSDGHIKLTDFGLSSTEHYKTPLQSGSTPIVVHRFKERLERSEKKMLYSGVGTPDYVSPEVLAGSGYGHTCDWWSVGCVLFEMLVGIPPFNDSSTKITIENIKKNKMVHWKEEVLDDVSKDLLKKLLEKNPESRLGYHGVEEIKSHSFFEEISWEELPKATPPFIPHLPYPHSTCYFKGAMVYTGEQPIDIPDRKENVFPEFDFTNNASLQQLNHQVLDSYRA